MNDATGGTIMTIEEITDAMAKVHAEETNLSEKEAHEQIAEPLKIILGELGIGKSTLLDIFPASKKLVKLDENSFEVVNIS